MKFLNLKKDWILQTSEYYARLRNEYGEENLKLNTIAFLGKKYNLKITRDMGTSIIVSDNLKCITFHVKDRRRYKDDVKRWYSSQTSKIVAERLNQIRRMNPELPSYNKVTIKHQRSSWGSCSKNGNLNFNLLLASLPLELIDYVINHELAHLVVLDHSKEFWKFFKFIFANSIRFDKCPANGRTIFVCNNSDKYMPFQSSSDKYMVQNSKLGIRNMLHSRFTSNIDRMSTSHHYSF